MTKLILIVQGVTDQLEQIEVENSLRNNNFKPSIMQSGFFIPGKSQLLLHLKVVVSKKSNNITTHRNTVNVFAEWQC